jgi:phosphate/sulfate permease
MTNGSAIANPRIGGGHKLERVMKMLNEMVPWIVLPLIGLLLGALFTFLFFSSKNAHAAQKQILSLRRSVQEKNAEIELLYQTIRKKTIQEEVSHIGK